MRTARRVARVVRAPWAPTAAVAPSRAAAQNNRKNWHACGGEAASGGEAARVWAAALTRDRRRRAPAHAPAYALAALQRDLRTSPAVCRPPPAPHALAAVQHTAGSVFGPCPHLRFLSRQRPSP